MPCVCVGVLYARVEFSLCGWMSPWEVLVVWLNVTPGGFGGVVECHPVRFWWCGCMIPFEVLVVLLNVTLGGWGSVVACHHWRLGYCGWMSPLEVGVSWLNDTFAGCGSVVECHPGEFKVMENLMLGWTTRPREKQLKKMLYKKVIK